MPSTTFATSAYERVKADIIACSLKPGSRLLIRDISERYEVSLSPMREALNRLSSESLVVLNDQRGFSVSEMSVDGLEELTRTRIWLNEVGLRHAIRSGDFTWEEQIVLAFHRLARVPRLLDNGDLNPAWNVPHRTFHSVLIEACPSCWIRVYCDQLFDQSERYRNLSRSIVKALRGDNEEHRAIMDAIIARDEDGSVALMTTHVKRTTDILLTNWDEIARSMIPAD
jgi:DNA-binding GntR family transcriptional regulator